MAIVVRFLAVVVLATSVLGACQPRRASPTMSECVPNHPLACTTMNAVSLGLYERPIPAAIEPCMAKCSDPSAAALGTLESLIPGHAPLIRVDEFQLDLRKICPGQICGISGARSIFVFYFGDGTAFAVDMWCGVGPMCRAIEPDG